MKVLVCGSRDWKDSTKLGVRLSKLPEGTMIIEGACRGADAMAREFAAAKGWPVHEFYAHWDLHGKAAGPIRNRKMLDEKPDLVLAFCLDIAKSKGTKDCVNEARRRGIPVEIIV